MSIFKRGRVYWYHLTFNGQHIQESTKQGNPNVARQIEAAHRTSLAKGEVGIQKRNLSQPSIISAATARNLGRRVCSSRPPLTLGVGTAQGLGQFMPIHSLLSSN